ncbi:hypothetical protein KME66_24055 [Streptomyces sp. YPW6]|uniref:hypothetical protein n=1 Tax=Streptomyces sp. YPW6 TaxID=2840373 RepID=UPI001C0DA281|nr:hypothetical protein [Streptomyces sp. YPW6]QWQ43704.1 hypothetical protein KME66_24055 [Streptomyces sp. YPW6]
MTDFEQARRLRAQLGEERIAWMEKLTKAREAAQASVATLGQVEALSFFELATDRVMGREAQRARPLSC